MASVVPQGDRTAAGGEHDQAVTDGAFDRLYRQYVSEVYRYALALLRNPADAEDVTQTTFLNAYRAMSRGEEPRVPHNWLIKIAHNACKTRYVRRSRQAREVPLHDVVEEIAVPEEQRTDVKSVLNALGTLPFNQRSALVMRELEGRSYAEIAQTLGVTVPAVETLLFRARRSLRDRTASLRVLGAVQLPSSLQSFFENTGTLAAGGGLAALGTGIAFKAATLLVAGAVAGGVAYSTVHATDKPWRAAVQSHEPEWNVTASVVMDPRGGNSVFRSATAVTAQAAVASAAGPGAVPPKQDEAGTIADPGPPFPDQPAVVAPRDRGGVVADESARRRAEPATPHPHLRTRATPATPSRVSALPRHAAKPLKGHVPRRPKIKAVLTPKPPVHKPPAHTPPVPPAPRIPPVPPVPAPPVVPPVPVPPVPAVTVTVPHPPPPPPPPKIPKLP